MDGFYSVLFTSSIFILAIVLIRAVFQKKISMRLQYALWLLVAAKLLLLPVPQLESALSVQKLLEPWENVLQQRLYGMTDQRRQGNDGSMPWGTAGKEQRDRDSFTLWGRSSALQQGSGSASRWEKTGGEQNSPGLKPDENTGTDGQPQQGGDGSVPLYESNKPQQGFGIVSWLGLRQTESEFTWLFVRVAGAGCAAMFLYFLLGNIRFAGYLRKRRIRFVKNSCPLPVYLVEGLPSPCLYGRAVYITPDLTADERRLSHVLTHEYCHYRQGDLIWSMLRCLCLILYWWNPLVWVAAYLSKQDCELACDEAAMALLGAEERISYGRTLIGMIPVKTKPKDYLDQMFIAATMTGGGRNMKQRIQRIAKKQKTILSVCLLAIFLSVLCFVSSSTVKPTAESNQTDPVQTAADSSQDKALWENTEGISVEQDNGNEEPSIGEDRSEGLIAVKDENGDTAYDKDVNGGSVSSKDENVDLASSKDENGVSSAYESGNEDVPAGESDSKKAIFDLDEAVGQAVLSYNEDRFWSRECVAEGHKILRHVQEEKGQVTAYVLTMYGEYAFHDGYFIKDSGTGIIPVVMKFSYDDAQGYIFEDCQKPTDGGGYIESIHDLFPEDLWEACITYSEEMIEKLTKKEQAYAKKYLKKIGRKAPVGKYRDVEHPLLTDAGVSVEVSNKMCDLGKDGPWKYPDWIGNMEEVEDGVRYVYEMALDKKEGEIIYTKTKYDTGEVVEQFRYDMYTGKKLA